MTFPAAPPPVSSTEQLIKLYLKAQETLIREIQALTVKGNLSTAQLKSQLLTAVNRTLTELADQTHEWSAANIPGDIAAGVREADAAIAEQFISAGQDIPDFPAAFAVIDPETVEVVVAGIDDTFDQIIEFTAERLGRNFTQIANEAISTKIVTGQTVKQAQIRLVEMLNNEGIVAFVDRGGREWQLSTYAEMVARSTTREITNLASVNRSRQVAGDLVIMSAHATSCPICWPLQGRVYSISGTNPNYPPLETAWSGGFANIHPNCRHSVKPYIPALKTPEEIARDLTFSNRPMEIEDMSQAAQRIFQRNNKNYQAGQQRRAIARQNAKQWQRYQARLGKDAPARLSTFMRIKNANGPAWQKLQTDYRAAGVELKQGIVEV